MPYIAKIEDSSYKVKLVEDNSSLRVSLDERKYTVDALCIKPGLYSLLINGSSYEIDVMKAENSDELIVMLRGEAYRVNIADSRSYRTQSTDKDSSATKQQKITAPMPGKVTRHLAQPGDEVEIGDGIIVLEAMKMENELKAPSSGTVKEILAEEGSVVKGGDTLVIIE